MLKIQQLFPDGFYTESEIYDIADRNRLQVNDTEFATFKVLEIVECFHEDDDPTGHNGGKRYGECDLDDDDHETLGEFRNDNGDGSLFALNL